jgi:hypothetical protein
MHLIGNVAVVALEDADSALCTSFLHAEAHLALTRTVRDLDRLGLSCPACEATLAATLAKLPTTTRGDK